MVCAGPDDRFKRVPRTSSRARGLLEKCGLPDGYPLSLKDARRLVAEFVTDYITVRLDSAISYITTAGRLGGRVEAIWAWRREEQVQADARRRAMAKEKAFAQSQSRITVTLREPGRRIGQRGDATQCRPR